jgi:hypothetical protein
MHFFQTYVAFRTKNEALSRNLPRHNNLTSRSPAASNSLLRLAFSNHTLDLRIDLELLGWNVIQAIAQEPKVLVNSLRIA